MEQQDYGRPSAMLETGSEDDSESGSDEWQRQIIQMKPGVAFSGKTTIGDHRVYRRKLLSKIFKRRDASLFGMSGDAASRWTINRHSKKLSTDEAFIQFLKKNVGKAIVEEEMETLTKQKEGDICVIQKDKTPEPKLTKTERYKNIQGGWSHAVGSAKNSAIPNAKSFIRGRKFIVSGETFARKMLDSLVGDIPVVIGKTPIGNEITITIAPESINKVFPDEAVENLMFWLRWNSWKKFEKVVVANTDFDNFPTEWDSVYGSFWRAVNGKEKRFEECYEVEAEIDARLDMAISHSGVLFPEEEDDSGDEETSIDVGDYDF